MFDLDQAIANWRQQMLSAGIKTPVPLEELESHLREDVEERMCSGVTAQQAFETSARQIGQAKMLQPEFSRAGETIYEWMKRHCYALARIPNYQLATNMNTSNSNLEPGWATYLKNAALFLPAFFFWIGSLIFIVPKLKQICAVSDSHLSTALLLVLNVTDFVRVNWIWITIALAVALVLLEWRSHWWPRYRRLVFGISAYLMNFMALILLALLAVTAVMAAANLLDHTK